MWFSENPWPPMIIAAILAAVFLLMWNANHRGLHLVVAALFALLCGGFYFLEQAIVTEGERLQQRVVQLCEDFRDKKPTVLEYVSDTAPQVKLQFASALVMVTVGKDLRLSDFQTALTKDNTEGTVHFRANASLNVVGVGDVGYSPARLILTFQREKGEWKIIKVQRLNPLNGKEMDVLEQSAG
jgi:hypothetical protein